MDDKLPPLKDHFLVQYILGKVVNSVCKCEMVPQNNIDQMEDYPFLTFHWLDVGTDTTSDWLGDSRQYTCRLQLDAHAHTDLEAMKLVNNLWSALKSETYKRWFKQARVVPQDLGNTGDRTALAGINYDHDFGFDCSFLVTAGKEYKVSDFDFSTGEDVIENITGTDMLTQTDVSASKKEDK